MAILNSTKSKLSAAVAALVVSGASATLIETQLASENEGLSLKAYQDGARTWTICRGHTAGVKPGETATLAMCDAFFKSDVGQAMAQIDALVKVPMTEPERAGVTDFCAFNVGIGKCQNSTFLKELNAGKRQTACQQIMRWIYVGGKDCRVASSNCAGIVTRREQETELCLL